MRTAAFAHTRAKSKSRQLIPRLGVFRLVVSASLCLVGPTFRCRTNSQRLQLQSTSLRRGLPGGRPILYLHGLRWKRRRIRSHELGTGGPVKSVRADR